MNVNQILFLFIAGLGILAALGTVLARNLVHAALFLVGFFFVVACQFVLLEAEFLAAIQVLVYIGAVAILMMFGIMLTKNIQGDVTTTVSRGLGASALAAGLAFFFVLVFGINNHVGLRGRSDWAATVRRPVLAAASPRAAAVNDMGKAVGDEMMTRYALPFEVAGLLLTVALVGAVALAHRESGEEHGSPSKRGTRAALVARGAGGPVGAGRG